MSMLPKHEDQNPHYDPKEDFTLEQMHRFTKVANQAQKNRNTLEQLSDKDVSIVEAARRAAMRPVIHPKPNKPNTARYAAWMVVVCAVGLWIMYMTR